MRQVSDNVTTARGKLLLEILNHVTLNQTESSLQQIHHGTGGRGSRGDQGRDKDESEVCGNCLEGRGSS